MAFTVVDFQDLLKLLSDHPEWRTQLRPLVLGEEVLAIPSRMDRVEATLDRLTGHIDDLTVRLDRLTERVDDLTVRLDRLTERVDDLTVRLDRLTGEVRELTTAVSQLVSRMDHTDGRLGNLQGTMLEWKFERNLGNWLREWVRRPRKVFVDELSRLDEAVERGLVAEAEVSQVAWSDAVVRAQDASTQDEVILSVELSTTVNEDGVERASARAAVLRRAGYDGRGFVAGHSNSISTSARELAEATGTTVVLIRPDS